MLRSNITQVIYSNTSAVFRAHYFINNVTTSDSGTYTCNVTNPIGSDSAMITVEVTGMYVAAIWKKGLVVIDLINDQ